MKLRFIISVMLTMFSLTAFADNSTASSETLTSSVSDSQTTHNLKTASINGSPILNTQKENNAIEKNTASSLTTDTDKISYAMGYEIGRSFKSQNLEISPNVMGQGILDGFSNNKSLMNEKEIQTAFSSFQKAFNAKRQSQLAELSKENKAAGDAFLSENKKKPGVITLPDGLQYKVIKSGSGLSPKAQDLVTLNYSGTLPNGQTFSDSYSRGKPLTFRVSEVIQGWSEALQMMKPGAIWEIYVPASLAYGDRGIDSIGPNQALVFKIELISVNASSTANHSSVDQPLKVASSVTDTNPTHKEV